MSDFPADYPEYKHAPRKSLSRRHRSIMAHVDAMFIVFAAVLSLWLAGALLVEMFHATSGIMASWTIVLLMTLCWLSLAYLALPRMHQLFTLIYVPDYFIGRTKTPDGLLGDPVNLAFDGRAEDIHCAMQRAGWTLADPVTFVSSWRIIVSSLFRRSYPEAPVSDLYLFGHAQERECWITLHPTAL